jgi:serine/threonine-protein kinase
MAVQTFIGRYEIIAELGRGAMGSVFKANDPAVGRIVALKTIHSVALSGAQAAEYRARFYREARASGVLAHPAIVPVFDVGEHEGAPFLVMEFVDGHTLDSAMKKGERFTLDRVCDIGQQLADALGYAHRQGVIHRDIKPANILMTSREVYGSERPRITDFGIAKLAASEITTTGQMLGTPAYMPPEQFTGAPIDGRADLFSLGVILFSMAAGEQPFLGETMTAVSYKVVHVDPIPPSKLNPAIPPALEGVILKCLAKNPAARYQTGEELAQDLATLRVNPNATLASTAPAASDPNATLAAAPSSISHPPAHTYSVTQKPAAPAKKPSKPLKIETIAAVVLLAVAAAGAGGWFYFVHHRPAPPQKQAVIPPAPPPSSPFGTPDLPPAPAVPQTKTPAPAPAAPGKPTPSKPAPATTKPQIATQQTTPPPATNPAPASTPAANTAPPPVAKPAKTTTPPATAPATAASDPHKLDPNANSKFKIELSHMPNGVPLTVEMNKAVYLRFISGDKTDLNNLFVPPGTQTFRVIAQNGSKQVESNIVSSEFKAKKKKNFKIELQNQANVPVGASAPLSPGAQIFVSLSTPIF